MLRLTFDRPEVRNAMSAAMVGELVAALDAAEAGGTARLVVLRGAGGTFCAGGDVSDMARARSVPAGDGDAIRALSVAFGELSARFARSPLAIVAAVEGAAMGGGFGLACVADVAIAAPDARFGLPETSLGLVPAQIAPYLIERVGYSQARRLSVLGGSIDAEEAMRIGLVHAVAEDMDAALRSAVGRILKCAPGALAATKQLLFDLRLAATGTMIDRAADVFVEAVRGPEGVEGTKAFLEKRKPAWVPG